MRIRNTEVRGFAWFGIRWLSGPIQVTQPIQLGPSRQRWLDGFTHYAYEFIAYLWSNEGVDCYATAYFGGTNFSLGFHFNVCYMNKPILLCALVSMLQTCAHIWNACCVLCSSNIAINNWTANVLPKTCINWAMCKNAQELTVPSCCTIAYPLAIDKAIQAVFYISQKKI